MFCAVADNGGRKLLSAVCGIVPSERKASLTVYFFRIMYGIDFNDICKVVPQTFEKVDVFVCKKPRISAFDIYAFKAGNRISLRFIIIGEFLRIFLCNRIVVFCIVCKECRR